MRRWKVLAGVPNRLRLGGLSGPSWRERSASAPTAKLRSAVIVASALFLASGCVDEKVPAGDEPILAKEELERLKPLSVPSTMRAVRVVEPVFIPAGEKTTLIYSCRQARPEALATSVEGLVSPEGTFSVNPSLNVIVVTDRPEVIMSIAKVLTEVDRKTPQLLVEARVVEVTVNDDLETEIRHRLTTPGGDNFFQNSDTTLQTPGAAPTNGQGSNISVRPFSPGDYALDSFVRLLLTRGKAKILSSPNLLVSAGSEASIITGQEVPVQSATVVGTSSTVTTQFKRVGIKLRVSLQQITNDTARIELNPEVSTVTGYVNTGTAGDSSQVISNPIIAIRNVSSTLTLKDGEILTVGGLLSTEDRETVRGVPLLMDIPVAGNLFKATRKQRSRTQLMFFLRAHVLAEGDVDGIRVHNPDSSMKALDALPKKVETKDGVRVEVPTTNPSTFDAGPGGVYGDKTLEKK